MGHCNTKSKALKTAKICFIQVMCCFGDHDDVAYDLMSFVDPYTKRIDLEPVIHNMIGMVLLKRKSRMPGNYPIFNEDDNENMEDEQTIQTQEFDIEPEDVEGKSYKERVEAALHAQCEFIAKVQSEKKFFNSPDSFKKAIVD